MQTVTASQAQNRFDKFLNHVQHRAVQVTRLDCMLGVLVSAQDCAAMHAFCVNRLQQTLQQSAVQAAAAGFTLKAPPALLNHER